MTEQDIIKAVCAEFSIDVLDISKPTRKAEIMQPRQMAQYVIRKVYPALALKQIAMFFGKGDHSTVINSVNTIQNLIDTEVFWMEAYYSILARLSIKTGDEFRLIQEDYSIEAKKTKDKILLTQDGSLITITHENIRQLYLTTL